MFGAMDISASGLYAQRARMKVIANNLANAESYVRGPDGTMTPYRRQRVVFELGSGVGPKEGVSVPKIIGDQSEFRRVYDPDNPYAGPDGYALMPNVNPIVEMVDMMEATRAYEANVTAMDATKTILANTLRIIA